MPGSVMTASKTKSELRLAKRMARLGTETAFEVLVRARALESQGKEVIHLEIGEPDFDTPSNIVEAAVDALRNGYTHYGPAFPSCGKRSRTTSPPPAVSKFPLTKS